MSVRDSHDPSQGKRMNKQENLLLSKFGNDPKELAEALREFSKSAERLSKRPSALD